MRLFPLLGLTIALTAVVGCDSKPVVAPPLLPQVGAQAAVPAEDLPTADNLDYVNWRQFKVGTTVKRKSVTRIGENQTVSVDTFKLLAVNDREVVVERQNTTERSDGSYKAVNPPEKRTYPKSFKVPSGLTAEALQKPALAAKETGVETITAYGKEYKAKVFQWTDRTEAGEMPIAVWLSDEMPGRIVKQEMKVAAIKSHTLEEVIEVVMP